MTPGGNPIFNSFEIIVQDQASIHFLSYKNALLSAVRQARRRVWILCYVVNANLSKKSDPVTLLMSFLRDRQAAGCDIRFIIDDPQINRPNYHCNKFFMRHLQEWGFSFCTPPASVTSHAKAVLIDDRVLFVGSHNLAKSSLTNPLDCTIELKNPFLIQSFAETYTMIWNDRSMVSYTANPVPTYKFYG
jgi:phosphatidylserine/phosphatidylglycerophosphate/cardiolipin synthase-like enzyme